MALIISLSYKRGEEGEQEGTLQMVLNDPSSTIVKELDAQQ